MSGTVNIARALWDDPTFNDSEMSQREAWVWMIADASWKIREKRFGSREIKLDRGQLVVSTRFLAKAWMWSEPRVRRYLDMLENRRMITRATDAGVTVITICKYDDYQNKPRVDDAAMTQQPTQDRRTSDANYNKDEIREEKKEHGSGEFFSADDTTPKPSAKSKTKNADEDFERFWKVYPKKVGKPAAAKNFAKVVKDGADPDEIIAGAERYAKSKSVADGFVKHPQGWLTDERWNDDDAPTLRLAGGNGGHRLSKPWGEVVR